MSDTINTFNIKGSKTTATVYANTIDDITIGQIQQMTNEDAMEGASIAIMPDSHFGKGSTVGTTIQLPKDGTMRIVPQTVGVDVGCSVSATKLSKTHLTQKELKTLDDMINHYIPAGFNVNTRETNQVSMQHIDRLIRDMTIPISEKDILHIKKSVGTLGGGNHFISLESHGDDIWLLIHTGSRKLGVITEAYHQNIADQQFDFDTRPLIEQLKAEGRQQEIESELQRAKNNHSTPQLKYLEGKLADDYLNDMDKAQQYAELNHEAIRNEILMRMGWEMTDYIHSMHNYVDVDAKIIRKGATDASFGKRLIIPLNMRDGSLIAVGKGNPSWNFSAPHGAGRIMSRRQAKSELDTQAYIDEMRESGVYTTSAVRSTLDEAPQAYKPKEDIIYGTNDTMDIVAHIKPIYNFKAH